MQHAGHVRVEPRGVAEVAALIAGRSLHRPAWRAAPHWWSDEEAEATATYVLLLDALNFSFWGEPRWSVTWRGERHDGYFGLAAALHRAIDEGEPITDPRYLAERADAPVLLRGDGDTAIPMLAERQAAMREVGRGVLDRCGGSFLSAVRHAAGSGIEVARFVAAAFPSFRDVASYGGRAVPFYKRAQILVADLWGAFEGRAPADFGDLAALTMFADYKVPRVLHGLGALAYSSELEGVLARRQALAYGDPREVEIRAASVCAVEAIGEELRRLGTPLAAFDVDWRLWTLGQARTWPLPYHRTRCVLY